LIVKSFIILSLFLISLVSDMQEQILNIITGSISGVISGLAVLILTSLKKKV